MTAWIDMLGGEVRFYNVNGIRTRCLEAGSGRPLLMLHARAGHAETWIKNVVPLGKQFHTYAIDLLGHGLTDGWDGDYTIGDIARHACAFLETVGARPAFVAGQAYGGQVAAWMAIERPDLVKAMVWASPAGIGGAGEGAAREPAAGAGTAAVDSAREAAITDPSVDNVRKRMQMLYFDPSLLEEETVLIRSTFYARPEISANAARVVAADNRPYALDEGKLATITCPVLMVGTEGGRAEVAERAAKTFPNGQYRLVKAARTWPQAERAEEFNQLVAEFLGGIR